MFSIQYDFNDDISGGIYYYRLKQVDLDGAHEFFGPIAIANGSTESNIDVFPNPVKNGNGLYVSLSSIYENVYIEIVNISGVKVYESDIIMDSPNKLHKISDLNLNVGLYIITFKYGSEQYRSKFIIN